MSAEFDQLVAQFERLQTQMHRVDERFRQHRRDAAAARRDGGSGHVSGQGGDRRRRAIRRDQGHPAHRPGHAQIAARSGCDADVDVA